MRPFKGRVRIRGTFSRSRVPERLAGRGRGSPLVDPENAGRGRGAPRKPLFYPDDRHEIPSSALYDELDNRHHLDLPPRNRYGNPLGNISRDEYPPPHPPPHRGFGSRSPSPYDNYNNNNRERRARSLSRPRSVSRSRSRCRSRTRSRSRSRTRSRTRSRSKSRSPPSTKRGRSPSRSPRRRRSRSPSYSPRRRSRSAYRSRSRSPERYRKDDNRSATSDFRDNRRIEPPERTVDALTSLSRSPERTGLRITVGNFKRDERTFKNLKSPAEDMFADPKIVEDKRMFLDPPKHEHDSLRFGRDSPAQQRTRGRMSPKRDSSRFARDSPRIDSRDMSPTRWAEGLKRHGDSKELVMKDRFGYKEDFRHEGYEDISHSKKKESEYLKERQARGRSRSPSPLHSKSSKTKPLKSPNRSPSPSHLRMSKNKSLKSPSRSPSPQASRMVKNKNLKSPTRWIESPMSHDSFIDSKPKSILKRKSLGDDESDSHSSLIGIPGLSNAYSGNVIPGLGDVDAIEDEEKYLYGDESEEHASKKSSSQYHHESHDNHGFLHSSDDASHSLNESLSRRHNESGDFRKGRDSPTRNYASPSPQTRRDMSSYRDHLELIGSPNRSNESPYRLQRIDLRGSDELSSKLTETLGRSQGLLGKRKASDDSDFSEYLRSREKYTDKDTIKAGNRKLEDVLKSMGFNFDMVKKLQENQTVSEFQQQEVHSPIRDIAKEAAELYGIHPDSHTSYMDSISKLTEDATQAMVSRDMEDSTSSASQHYLSNIQQQQQQQPHQSNPYLNVNNEPQYTHQHMPDYTQPYDYNAPSQHETYPYSQQQYIPPPQYSQPPPQTTNYSEAMARSNLKVIPLQQSLSNNLVPVNKISPNVMECRPNLSNLKQIPISTTTPEEKFRPMVNTPVKIDISTLNRPPLTASSMTKPHEREPEETVKSVKDIQMLLNKREKHFKRLELLENELCHLAKQQGELMRKKQKQKDGHKDPLLVENSKLQEEISQEITMTKQSIEETTALLKGSDFFLKVRQLKEEKTPDQRVLKLYDSLLNSAGSDILRMLQKTSQVPTEKPVVKSHPSPIEKTEPEDNNDPECEYTDSGNHWCKICNEFLPNLPKWFAHLQSKEHYKNIDPSDLVVLADAFRPPKIIPKQSQKRLLSAIKGVQFLVPSASYFCKLCSEFLGNNASAEYHLKSKEHNFKYLKFVLENPQYERKWNSDKFNAMSAKAEEVKKKRVEQDREREEKRKKRVVEAEMRNKELIKAEAERAKQVGELDESPKASSSKLSSSKGKEIKLTLKKENNGKESSKEEGGFGKFTWKKDSEKKEEVPQKSEELPGDSFAKDKKTGSKIAIRLIGKTIIAPSIPWQAVAKTGGKPMPLNKQMSKASITSFPLRKGKNESGIDRHSSMDIFTDNSAGRGGRSTAGNDRSSGGFAPSKMDIANAFVGKFEANEENESAKSGGSEEKCSFSTSDLGGDTDMFASPKEDPQKKKTEILQETSKNQGLEDKESASESATEGKMTTTKNPEPLKFYGPELPPESFKLDEINRTNEPRVSEPKTKEQTINRKCINNDNKILLNTDSAIVHEEKSVVSTTGSSNVSSVKDSDQNLISKTAVNCSSINSTKSTGGSFVSNKAVSESSIENVKVGPSSTISKANSSTTSISSTKVEVPTSSTSTKVEVPTSTTSTKVEVPTSSTSSTKVEVPTSTSSTKAEVPTSSTKTEVPTSSTKVVVPPKKPVKIADTRRHIPKGPSNVVCDYIMMTLAKSTLKRVTDNVRRDLSVNSSLEKVQSINACDSKQTEGKEVTSKATENKNDGGGDDKIRVTDNSVIPCKNANEGEKVNILPEHVKDIGPEKESKNDSGDNEICMSDISAVPCKNANESEKANVLPEHIQETRPEKESKNDREDNEVCMTDISAVPCKNVNEGEKANVLPEHDQEICPAKESANGVHEALGKVDSSSVYKTEAELNDLNKIKKDTSVLANADSTETGLTIVWTSESVSVNNSEKTPNEDSLVNKGNEVFPNSQSAESISTTQYNSMEVCEIHSEEIQATEPVSSVEQALADPVQKAITVDDSLKVFENSTEETKSAENVKQTVANVNSPGKSNECEKLSESHNEEICDGNQNENVENKALSGTDSPENVHMEITESDEIPEQACEDHLLVHQEVTTVESSSEDVVEGKKEETENDLQKTINENTNTGGNEFEKACESHFQALLEVTTLESSSENMVEGKTEETETDLQNIITENTDAEGNELEKACEDHLHVDHEVTSLESSSEHMVEGKIEDTENDSEEIISKNTHTDGNKLENAVDENENECTKDSPEVYANICEVQQMPEESVDENKESEESDLPNPVESIVDEESIVLEENVTEIKNDFKNPEEKDFDIEDSSSEHVNDLQVNDESADKSQLLENALQGNNTISDTVEDQTLIATVEENNDDKTNLDDLPEETGNDVCNNLCDSVGSEHDFEECLDEKSAENVDLSEMDKDKSNLKNTFSEELHKEIISEESISADNSEIILCDTADNVGSIDDQSNKSPAGTDENIKDDLEENKSDAVDLPSDEKPDENVHSPSALPSEESMITERICDDVEAEDDVDTSAEEIAEEISAVKDDVQELSDVLSDNAEENASQICEDSNAEEFMEVDDVGDLSNVDEENEATALDTIESASETELLKENADIVDPNSDGADDSLSVSLGEENSEAIIEGTELEAACSDSEEIAQNDTETSQGENEEKDTVTEDNNEVEMQVEEENDDNSAAVQDNESEAGSIESGVSIDIDIDMDMNDGDMIVLDETDTE